MSVNQMNCQVKLMEVWKAINLEGYPLKIAQQSVPEVGTSTRAAHKGKPINIGKSTATRNSCVSDSIRIWNLAPRNITESKTAYLAKKSNKRVCQVSTNLRKEIKSKGRKVYIVYIVQGAKSQTAKNKSQIKK